MVGAKNARIKPLLRHDEPRANVFCACRFIPLITPHSKKRQERCQMRTPACNGPLTCERCTDQPPAPGEPRPDLCIINYTDHILFDFLCILNDLYLRKTGNLFTSPAKNCNLLTFHQDNSSSSKKRWLSICPASTCRMCSSNAPFLAVPHRMLGAPIRSGADCTVFAAW